MQKDAFDYIEDDDQVRSPDRSEIVWNILTALALMAALVIGIILLMVFINPQTSINPYPPPTMPVRAALDTPIPTPKSVLPATWTPEATLIPTNTPIPEVNEPPAPTQDEQVEPEDEKVEEIVGDMPIVLQDKNPYYIPAVSMNNSYGCEWMGVAGQVFAMNNAPVQGLVLEIGGSLSGERFDKVTVTGMVPAYGPGGYEVKLADVPVESSNSLWIRVLDQSGLPMSEKIYFKTFDDCDMNLILINFKQVR